MPVIVPARSNFMNCVITSSSFHCREGLHSKQTSTKPVLRAGRLTPRSNARFGSFAPLPRAARQPLLDHLVGALPEKHGHFEAESRGGLEVDYKLELDRGLHRKLARLGTFENAIRIGRRAPIIVD